MLTHPMTNFTTDISLNNLMIQTLSVPYFKLSCHLEIDLVRGTKCFTSGPKLPKPLR